MRYLVCGCKSIIYVSAILCNVNAFHAQVINFYMNLLMARGESENKPSVFAFNTFFYPKIMSDGHSGVRRWTRRVDIFSKDYILIPVHLGMHWCLAVSLLIMFFFIYGIACLLIWNWIKVCHDHILYWWQVVDFKKKEIRYYDSMGGENNSCLQAIQWVIISRMITRFKMAVELTTWR